MVRTAAGDPDRLAAVVQLAKGQKEGSLMPLVPMTLASVALVVPQVGEALLEEKTSQVSS